MGAEFTVGVLSSVIGGLFLLALKPSTGGYGGADRSFVLWFGTAVVSLVLGVAVGMLMAQTFADTFVIIAQSEQLGSLLSGLISVATAIIFAVAMQRALFRAWDDL